MSSQFIHINENMNEDATVRINEPFDPEEFLTEYVNYIENCKTSHEVLRRLLWAGSHFEFSICSIMFLPGLDSHKVQPHLLLTSWPESFVSEFDKSNFLTKTQSYNHMRASTMPFCWHLNEPTKMSNAPDVSQLPETETIRQRLIEIGINTAVDCSVMDPMGRRYMVTFAGHRSPATYSEFCLLNLLAVHAVDRLYATASSSSISNLPSLTSREIECLRWTSDGKTSSEIGTILGISEHTVNYYIVEAIRKLGASSRTQAVALAIRLGLIK